eukprot:CAMPEP_0202708072 /NCGR_PEP_ID=MMETSP1385-20130828/20329_1 /ASSEMBLY_ACC=CAM_ASM_000861 /TAXON_ID=933848 /ORGANISM="Elphidium margaritaceum" /LENGTH=495 /DNA_ID=CAMNT_0049366957 /DNA_START=32 /DNA_END=1515 /DNA_ORIENTATION=+
MNKSVKNRFNLLCLEEGEIFFEDYACTLQSESTSTDSSSSSLLSARKPLPGRLKVCSHNLIFEPNSMAHPIIRFPYKSMLSLVMDQSKQHLIAITEQCVQMKKFGVLGPYHFIDIEPPQEQNGKFVFEPSYSRLDDFVGLVAKIYQITKSKSLANLKSDLILKLMYVRESKIQFDSSWYVDINEVEKLSKPLVVSKLEPLVELRGQLQLTSKRLYFQPFHSFSATPMLKYNLADIVSIYKRRHIMLPRALEIIFVRGDSLLLSLDDEVIRDNLYRLITCQPLCRVRESLSLSHAQQQWLCGRMSNYDYLMCLNQQSGRSFNDLTQYPIFPWILTDYESDTIDLDNINVYRDLSKPVGALNPQRLTKILQRYHDMPDDPHTGIRRFMYGSHYSTPGYVMYFLVRSHPELMLRFQNGRFDAADRLFSSVARSWDSAYHSLTDVKELIPQFYDTTTEAGRFLRNTANLNLGVRSDKVDVHHVQLPNWCHGDPVEFVET